MIERLIQVSEKIASIHLYYLFGSLNNSNYNPYNFTLIKTKRTKLPRELQIIVSHTWCANVTPQVHQSSDSIFIPFHMQ